jgi:SAM-dependent methyltransferase
MFCDFIKFSRENQGVKAVRSRPFFRQPAALLPLPIRPSGDMLVAASTRKEMPMPKTEPFEQHVDRYEQWFLDNPLAYLSEIKAIQALLPKSGEGVEIGVGTGRFAAPLKVRHGVEPVAQMAALARKRGVEVSEGTAERLPFDDGRFDFALMVTTLCFVDDPPAALAEARRVLKPGGVLVVGLVDRASPLGKSLQKQKGENLFYREAAFHSAAEVAAMMREAGFADFTFTQTLFRPLAAIEGVEPVREGHGKGSFVAIRGKILYPQIHAD